MSAPPAPLTGVAPQHTTTTSWPQPVQHNTTTGWFSGSADGMRLLAGGAPFVWRGTLDWSLLGRHLNEGEGASRPIVIDRRSVGANTICTAGMLSWGSPFDANHPNYWTQEKGIWRLADVCMEEQMRLCVVVFCDTRTLMPGRPEQIAHWERLKVTLGGKPNVSYVLVNQAGHGTQTIGIEDLNQFAPPVGVAGNPPMFAATDNPMEDGPSPLPAWNYSLFCSKRNYPNWYCEAGCFSMWNNINGWGSYPGTHGPTILFEPPPACRRPEWQGPGRWREFGRSLCFAGTIGGNFYSDQNANAQLLSGEIRDCAVEYLGNIPNP